MKVLVMAALFVGISEAASARSILTFKTVRECVTAENPKKSEVIVTVQEAADGQSQLIVEFTGEEADTVVVQTKKIVPPPMMAGGTIRYVGKVKDLGNADITLAIGLRPIKVGKFVGRASSLTIDQLLSNLPMICK